MKLFLQIYYSFLFIVLYNKLNKLINFDSDIAPDYIFFAKPLKFFLKVEIHDLIFLCSLFFVLCSILKPYRLLRILTAVFILIFFSIIYSYGKIYHSSHAFILSSVLVCFFDENKNLNFKRNFFTLRLVQGILLCSYFMSGLWKLRFMISSNFTFSFNELIMNYISYTLVSQDLHPILKFLLYEEPWLLSFAYFCVLVFQLTSLVPIIFDRWFRVYGVLAILFHLSTGLVLGIYFYQTVLAVLAFFILAENIKENK